MNLPRQQVDTQSGAMQLPHLEALEEALEIISKLQLEGEVLQEQAHYNLPKIIQHLNAIIYNIKQGM